MRHLLYDPAIRLIRRSPRQAHISSCARHLVHRRLDWLTDSDDYLRDYWETHDLRELFESYQEFLEEVGYAMNEILVGGFYQDEDESPLSLVVDNTRRGSS